MKSRFTISLGPSRIRAFIFGVCVIVLFQFIQSLNLHPFHALRGLISPVSRNEVPVSEKIKKKLEESPKGTLELKTNPSLVAVAEASNALPDVRSYIVINEDTGDIISEKESTVSLPIASLTKIMTALVTLDLSNPSDIFTVTKSAADQIPTKIGVVAGQKMTVSELLNALLLTSANDAAEVLRDGVDARYGAGAFVLAMNEKAQLLKLSHTHFDNPQGLDGVNNYSSAHDLAILAHYALQNYPLISEITQKDYVFLSANAFHKQFDLYNWNGLLGVYPGIRGVKIGNTDAAGKTTIVAAVRNDKKILTVVLGAPGITERDLDAAYLLDTGFESLGVSGANITKEELLAKYQTWKYWN